ncbi:MAG: hypothetical protein ACPGID_14215, partial [Rubricella sp.]
MADVDGTMMDAERSRAPTGRSGAPGALLAAGLLYLVLVAPNHPAALAPAMLLVFPLELPVILIALAVLPARSGLTTLVRIGLVASLMVLTILKLADFATFSTYNRGFNPLVDMHLIPAAWNLGSGAIGGFAA